MTDYPYPGDDPASVASASSTFDANITNMHTLIGAVNTAESNIKGNWKGDTATAASGDIAKINKVLALTAKDFKTSKSALDALHEALVPIRHQVDDLRRKLSTAQRTLQSEQDEYGRAARLGEVNHMTDDQVAKYRTVVAGQERKTQGDITSLNHEYAALVRKANAATDTCSAALKATISGSTYDPNTSGIKGTNLDDILALDGLSLLHRYQAGKDATKAATDSKKLLTLQPGSPEAVKLAHELAALLHKYPDGDPDFSVPYLKQLGQDNLLKLTVYVAGLKTTGDGKALGQDIGEIQRDLGTDLAAATHLLGKANPNQTQQLDQSWVDTLLKDGGKGYQTSVGGYYYDIKGFQSLGILLRTGDYGSTFLSQSGDALMDYEKHYQGGLSSSPWLDLGAGVTQNLRLWWGAGDGKDTERGLDPFNGWVAGMENSSQAKQVLFDDVSPGDPNEPWKGHGLLSYLLDQRDWSIKDTDSGNPNFGRYDSGETRVGLTDLGSMLDQKIGVGAIDPKSKAIFQSMVHDLGSSGDDKNGGRINAEGGFTGNDWIPPELRPYLGDVTARNIDSVHEMLRDSDFDKTSTKTDSAENDYVRFLSDLGKDPTAGAAIYNAERTWAQHELSDPNHFHQNDVDALARVTGLLSHGHAAHDTGVQQAADEQHNKNIELIKSAVEAGTSAVEVPGGPVVGAGVDFVKGQFLDSIFSGMDQDHSAEVNAANSNYSAYMQEQTKQAVLTAGYQGIPDSVLSSVGAPMGADGHPVPYAQLDSRERGIIENHLQDRYGNRYELNFTSGSSAHSTAQFMEDYAKSIGAG